jgi:hypothetical protein
MGTALPPNMKINAALFPGRSGLTAHSKTSFGSVLKQTPTARTANPKPVNRPSTLLGVNSPKASLSTLARSAQQIFTTHEKTASTLAIARSAAHQNAGQLQQARVVHHQVIDERVDGRLVDLICNELKVEFTAEAAKSKVANQDLPPPPLPASAAPLMIAVPTGHSAQQVDGELKAAQAVELIEKIETFVKDSRRPCIALTLNNSLGAKVEIERVGPREVALKVVGHRGPPRAEDIGRIREEMRARGLKVAALSIA